MDITRFYLRCPGKSPEWEIVFIAASQLEPSSTATTTGKVDIRTLSPVSFTLNYAVIAMTTKEGVLRVRRVLGVSPRTLPTNDIRAIYGTARPEITDVPRSPFQFDAALALKRTGADYVAHLKDHWSRLGRLRRRNEWGMGLPSGLPPPGLVNAIKRCGLAPLMIDLSDDELRIRAREAVIKLGGVRPFDIESFMMIIAAMRENTVVFVDADACDAQNMALLMDSVLPARSYCEVGHAGFVNVHALISWMTRSLFIGCMVAFGRVSSDEMESLWVHRAQMPCSSTVVVLPRTNVALSENSKLRPQHGRFVQREIIYSIGDARMMSSIHGDETLMCHDDRKTIFDDAWLDKRLLSRMPPVIGDFMMHRLSCSWLRVVRRITDAWNNPTMIEFEYGVRVNMDELWFAFRPASQTEWGHPSARILLTSSYGTTPWMVSRAAALATHSLLVLCDRNESVREALLGDWVPTVD